MTDTKDRERIQSLADYPFGEPSTEAPPAKHRKPTKDDLKNGPIDCEVRNSDSEKDDWVNRVLVFISAYHSSGFVTVDPKDRDRIDTWNQCRIQNRGDT